MAGTRTAPLITDPASAKQISIRLVDASGDLYAAGLEVPVEFTATQIENIVAAYAALSQASVYEVNVSTIWSGVQDPTNAETNQRNSVAQGINFAVEDAAGSYAVRVVAPVPGSMIANTDAVNVGAVAVQNFVTALNTLPSTDVRSAQYTERRERRNNPRTRV